MKLDTPIQYLKGVGPRLGSSFARLGIATVRDLLWHLPFRYVDRRQVDPIRIVTVGKDRVVIGEVISSGIAFLGRRRTRIFEIIVADGSGYLSAKWFHFHPRGFAARFRKGTTLLLAGELTAFGGVKQFVHPEVEVLDGEGPPGTRYLTVPPSGAPVRYLVPGGCILPIYPATEGVSQRTLRRTMRTAWEQCGPTLRETLPESLRTAHRLEALPRALETLHFPPADADVVSLNARRHPAFRTLIFEESFVLELGLALRRVRTATERGAPMPHDAAMFARFRTTLPFTLTPAQERVCAEIAADLTRDRPMHRLVQGDVGSGKTVVAVAAALQAIAAGYQVALMAPTEILAEQHARTIAPWLAELRIASGLVTGKSAAKERERLCTMAAAGDLPLLIGTHALIEEGIQFARLGLVIIDEQHRFGVAQRLALKQKGVASRQSSVASTPHMLVMTATPIPRTLAMTAYGDLDVSTIDQLPAGRRAVMTKVYSEGGRSKLYAGMRKELQAGHQIYVVYPLVEESEKIDVKNATDMACALATTFAPAFRVTLLHGRMRSEEKEAIMQAFTAGEVHILATTSVVEVGVDVPNATVMVVEHAERFGLSQLHQLRGRVGRGAYQSYCILVADDRQSMTARARLQIMTETTDGFRIAEEDLQIRGPGEFLGTRQSGLPELKIVNVVTDGAIIAAAREAAFHYLTSDPSLTQPANTDLRAAVLERWGPRLALANVG